MLVFPNCKINLGLNVTARRPDGFHTIETVFYPVFWNDALEIIETKNSRKAFSYSQSGIAIDGATEQNLIYKAWKIISEQKTLPAIRVHLHKNIPLGAGLGGGSSDAASFINLLDENFNIGFTEREKMQMAARLGSDCPFFLRNKPVFASGKGDVFSDIKVDLSAYFILLVYPCIHSNTKEAYQAIVPKTPGYDLKHVLETFPVKEWKSKLVNDFEDTVFKKHPAIKSVKDLLYQSGALYASMSGSGSTVYGIFETEPKINIASHHRYYLQKPATKIL